MTNNAQQVTPKLTIKLTTPVLNALFPEGTEARVQLVQAAVTEISRKHIKAGLDESFHRHLERLADDVKLRFDVEKAVNSLFERKGWREGGGLEVKHGGDVAKAIAEHAEKSFNEHLYGYIEKAVSERISKVEVDIDSYIERAVSAKIRSKVNAEIEDKLRDAIAAAKQQLQF